jgi:uncharacterized membrane protein YgcG
MRIPILLALAITSTGCMLLKRKSTASEKPAEITKLEIATTTYCIEHARNRIDVNAFDAMGRAVKFDSDDVELSTDPPDLASELEVMSPVKTSLELFNTEITVKAAKKNSGLSAAQTLKPEFCDEIRIDFAGNSGQSGSSGASGGAPNATGGPGGPGGPGRDADPLYIEADTFIGPDKRTLMLVAFSQQDEVKRLLVHDPSKGPIAVSANGGSGGSGGSGGGGGDCGRGGDGSHGGNGGRGADVTMVLGDALLEALIKVSVAGGSGGSRGGAGYGGFSSSNCNYGGAGARGRDGQGGQSGQAGHLKVTVKKKPPLIQQALTTCARCPTK